MGNDGRRRLNFFYGLVASRNQVSGYLALQNPYPNSRLAPFVFFSRVVIFAFVLQEKLVSACIP